MLLQILHVAIITQYSCVAVKLSQNCDALVEYKSKSKSKQKLYTHLIPLIFRLFLSSRPID